VVDEHTSRIFVTFTDDQGTTAIAVLDTVTGKVLRIVPTGSESSLLVLDHVRDHLFSFNIYGHTAALWILDARDGTRLRTNDTLGTIPQWATVDEHTGNVFTTVGNRITVFAGRTGNSVRRIDIGHSRHNLVGLAVDPATRRVFVADQGPLDEFHRPTERGRVAMLDADTGKIRQTVFVPQWPPEVNQAAPAVVAIDAHVGHVFVLSTGRYQESGHFADPSYVNILDARTGDLLRSIRVGKSPGTMTVAERLGQLFVLNQEDNTVSVLETAVGL